MAYLITHIINQEPPKSGSRKVAFYTIDTNNSNSGEYFLGTDNNPLDSEYIENLILKKKITRLIIPVELRDDLTLFSDNTGELFIANYLDPSKNRVNIKKTGEVKNIISNTEALSKALMNFKNANTSLKFESIRA